MVKIPVTSNAGFEEVLEDSDASASGDQPMTIEQLARLLDVSRTGSGTEIRVRLIRPSPDVSRRHHGRDDDVDLPCDSDVILTAVIVEPCVLASVDSANRPAFHLPLRTDVDVRLVKYLEKRDSPLLSAHSCRLSTMDRCVEALCDNHLAAFMMSRRRDLSTDSNRSLAIASTTR